MYIIMICYTGYNMKTDRISTGNIVLPDNMIAAG